MLLFITGSTTRHTVNRLNEHNMTHLRIKQQIKKRINNESNIKQNLRIKLDK